MSIPSRALVLSWIHRPGHNATRRLPYPGRRYLALFGALVAAGCTDVAAPVLEPGGTRVVTEASSLAQATIDSLSSAISVALANSALRGALRDAMRDSPRDKHVLPIAEYLSSPAGLPLARALSARLGMRPPEFESFTNRFTRYVFWMERPLDRVRWQGTPDIVVYGSTSEEPGVDQAVVRGFGTDGREVEVSLRSFSLFPYLALVPNPEGRFPATGRRAMPGQPTISSREEEQERQKQRSELIACEYACGSGPVVEQGGILLAPGVNANYCFGVTSPLDASTDPDHDGVRNDCEYQLASAFRPMLARNNHDQSPEIEPYYSVKKWSNRVKLFYALSYYRDPGDHTFSIEAHDGDSEFIILTVHNTNDPRGTVWALDDETLSAHWGTGASTDHTSIYDFNSVEYPSYFRGAPRVWVSWGKHANYRSKDVCNSQWNDVCDTVFTGTAYEMVEVMASANLGNSFNTSPASISNRLVDCTSSRFPNYWGNVYPECFWSNPSYFAGWKGDFGQAKAGPYSLSLSFYGF